MTSENEPAEAARRREEAAEWFVRLKEPGVTDADHRAFRTWLAEDPSRHDAFNDVKRLWGKFEEPAIVLGEDYWYREGLRRPPSVLARSLTITAAFVTCAVMVGSGLIWREPGLLDRAFADFATSPGQRRSIILADGSRAELDGGTAIKVSFTSANRTVTLLHGRAWFDVSHDAAPAPAFIVRTGDVETRDIGTAFAVDHDNGNETNITVEQGLVAVSTPDAQSRDIEAGESVSVSGQQISEPVKRDPATALAWRQGLIVLDHAPLGKVADELARMQPRRLIFPDKALRDLTLTGVFQADDPAAIIDALHSALGLRTLSIPGFATLVYR